MFRKRMQLALIHLAVAMTLVPINSTLNRVMIKELALPATLVAVLASLPYLFSPVQMVIGAYSDRHPFLGWRRSPYIAAGLLLCVLGVVTAPLAVALLPVNWPLGLLASLLTFGAWGMGFNLATVAYLALASEISGEQGRTRTVSIMWFVMIVGIIFTAAWLSRLLVMYSPAALERAFIAVGMAALGLGVLGLAGLEPRHTGAPETRRRAHWGTTLRAVMDNTEARRFFIYLILMLAAILGQDVLLEPYAAEAFHLPVTATTRITSIWGGCVLVMLLLAGTFERWWGKHAVARAGALVAILAFGLIASSGPAGLTGMFYAGVVLLGLGTGLATVSNLSLMLDMTTARVGLFIGAWGMADALARLVGTLLAGGVRDLGAYLSGRPLWGYMIVFIIQAGLLAASLPLLRKIDAARFHRHEGGLSIEDRAALMEEV